MRGLLLLLGFFTIPAVATCQESPAESLARKIAKKIGDSLVLSIQERADILSVNLSIAAQKKAVFQNAAIADSVKAGQLQTIENSRDSLYKRIIGVERFEVYKIKKKSIVNKN